jgi:hypothetical protein
MQCTSVKSNRIYKKDSIAGIMSRKFLLAGIVGGLGMAMVLAFLVSGAATAQMMQHDQMQHNSGMKHTMFKAGGMSMVQDVSVSGLAITGDNEISVSLAYNGTGNAPSVTVVAMTNHEHMMSMMMGDSSSMGSMGGSSSMGGMMMGDSSSMGSMGGSSSMGGMMMGSGGMMGGSAMGSMGTMSGHSMMSTGSVPGWQHPDMPRWNATQWQHWHSQMTSHMNAQSWQMQSQSGGAVLESGWQSAENTVTIVLDGDTSAYGASDIFAVVFPHLT